jgi:uncharacterized membrane protein
MQVAVCGVLLAGVVMAAPRVREWACGVVPIDAFVNVRTGSLFPLFPWMGFVLFGVIAGSVFRNAMATGGVAVALGAGCFGRRPVPFSALHPEFFVERIAWVLGLVVLCEWLVLWWRPRAVLFAGRESLVMYAGHLVIIEWVAAAGVPRGGLGLPWTMVVFAGVLLAAFGVAFAGVRWQERSVMGPVAPAA